MYEQKGHVFMILCPNAGPLGTPFRLTVNKRNLKIAIRRSCVSTRGDIWIVPSDEEGRWECLNTSASQGEGPAPRLPMRPEGRYAHQECKGRDAKESRKRSSGSSIFTVAYPKDLSKNLQVD